MGHNLSCCTCRVENKHHIQLTQEVMLPTHWSFTNERFLSKAPADKVQEEKDKLASYEQMMAQVQERLAQMK